MQYEAAKRAAAEAKAAQQRVEQQHPLSPIPQVDISGCPSRVSEPQTQGLRLSRRAGRQEADGRAANRLQVKAWR